MSDEFIKVKKEVKQHLEKCAKKAKTCESFVKKVNEFINKKKKKNSMYEESGVKLLIIEENPSIGYYTVKMKNPGDKTYHMLDIALEIKG